MQVGVKGSRGLGGSGGLVEFRGSVDVSGESVGLQDVSERKVSGG